MEDVALATSLAALNAKPGKRVYNVSEEESLTEIEWIKRIAQVATKEAKIITVPAGMLPSHLREPLCWEQHLTMNSSLIRSESGYKELPVEERMKRSIEWIRFHECVDKSLLESLNYLEEEKVAQNFIEGLRNT